MTLKTDRLKSERGWTIIELIIIVAIMSILFSMVGAFYDSLKAKMRYAQLRADFDQIAQAAFNDFTSSTSYDWAPFVAPGDPPSFVTSGLLNKWPRPPCPFWTYSWDNFYGVPGVQAIRLTVRRKDLSAVWSFCLESYKGNCAGPDFWGGSAPEISSVNTKYVYCNE